MTEEQDTCRFRSPELIARECSALLVVDVQQKMLANIGQQEQIVWNIDRLTRAASLLKVPAFVSEQYPQRLGATVEPLRQNLGEAVPKRMFSCRECEQFYQAWRSSEIRQIVVCGIESHVCVLQTAFDLLAEGYTVYVVADAIGSRGDLDHQIALRRFETCGAVLTTTESVLFEWCETSTIPEFKQISSLITEPAPQPRELT